MRPPAFYTVVHFAVDAHPRHVAAFEVHGPADYLPARDRALRRAREYLGADAKGVWIEYPNGDRKVVDADS